MSFTISFHKKLKLNKKLKLTSFIVVFALVNTLNLSSFIHAQEGGFWHINVGNYLSGAEATQELNRLDALGFESSIIEVSENNATFNQLRVGCFLDEATATSQLNSLKNQLIYPSLSNLAKSETPATSRCLGFETGIALPKQWQIIPNDDIFLLQVTLLEYARLIGFNGLDWNTFQSEESISEAWQTQTSSEKTSTETTSNLECQSTQTETINCSITDYTFSIETNGEILWQKGNTVILKVGDSLNVLKVLDF